MTINRIKRINSFVLLTAALLVLAACGVTETPGNQGTITGVVVTPATATINVDATEQLAATVSGTGDFSNSVTWSSSDDAIATVSSTGLVTGHAAGTATITAASKQTTSVTGTSTITVVAQAEIACTDPADVITFADDQVEAAVRLLYGLDATGDIHCADVQQPITSSQNEFGQETSNVLYLSRCGDDVDSIRSLEGLQNLTRLVRLELACNGLTDLGPLRGMTSLVELNLDENDVNDLSPLAALTNLEVLGLYGNEVEELSPLSGLTKLRNLYASSNRIKDVTPLENLTALEQLWLFRNCRAETDDGTETDCLANIGPLRGLTNLAALLIDGNEVTSLEAVAGLAGLEFLNASGNEITDISPLGALDRLQTVLLDMNPISSLAALAANDDFPAGEPYGYRRGDVALPLRDGPVYAFNLRLGYNCLDLASEAIQAQLAELADRAVVEGADFRQRENPACVNGASIQPFKAWWN